MALAASGRLHPVAAALLMVGSSLIVVWRSTRLDPAGDCHRPEPTRDRGVGPALVHGLALAAQGPILAALAGWSGTGLVLLSTLSVGLGLIVARCWKRGGSSHRLDVLLGMATLGNLGMLLGWWADLGFGAVRVDHPCCRISNLGLIPAHPGMWLGMLLFGNLAMAFASDEGRRPSAVHLILCNLGMALGMLLGGEWAGGLGLSTPSAVAISDALGMALGMLAGMWGVHWAFPDAPRTAAGRLG